jgi:hypothetical protein
MTNIVDLAVARARLRPVSTPIPELTSEYLRSLDLAAVQKLTNTELAWLCRATEPLYEQCMAERKAGTRERDQRLFYGMIAHGWAVLVTRQRLEAGRGA